MAGRMKKAALDGGRFAWNLFIWGTVVPFGFMLVIVALLALYNLVAG